jgi:type IV pilus assembly protein PilO
LIVALVVASAVLYGSWHFVIKDQIRTVERLVQQEAELKSTFSMKKGMVVNLPAYQTQMGEIEDLLSELVAQLPDSSEVPRLLVEITEAGKQRGLEFLVFDPLEEIQREFYALLPIRVEVSGTYHQLAGFISHLSALPRIVTVGDMSIIADKEGQLLTSILLQTYRYQDDG